MAANTYLRFLADESCDFSVVRQLRKAGYDVEAVAEYISRSDDRELIDMASRDERILLTEDKDFGWLVYVSEAQSSGVILIRFPGNARSRLASTIVGLVTERADVLRGSFVVVQPGYIRIRQRPG